MDSFTLTDVQNTTGTDVSANRVRILTILKILLKIWVISRLTFDHGRTVSMKLSSTYHIKASMPKTTSYHLENCMARSSSHLLNIGPQVTRQMYLLEIFIDKINVLFDPAYDPHTDRALVVRMKFIPQAQFIFRESQLAHVPHRQTEPEIYDDKGTQRWSRTMRVGKSYLFPSDPVQMRSLLNKYPLEFELWTDEPDEEPELIGSAFMYWDRGFFFLLQETSFGKYPLRCEMFEPLSLKQRVSLSLECCCKECAQIDFTVRLTALGNCVSTLFQQLMKDDPNAFLSRADNVPSVYECRRVEPDNKFANMDNTLYDQAIASDPAVIARKKKKIEVCTQMQSCGASEGQPIRDCQSNTNTQKQYPIQSIKMGDIAGPCGNKNCELANKIKIYLRNLQDYKKQTLSSKFEKRPPTSKSGPICGQCACKEDRWHKDETPKEVQKKLCAGCGGMAADGETCNDRLRALHGTGLTPIGSRTNIFIPTNYLTDIIYDDPEQVKAIYAQNFIVFPCEAKYTTPPPTQYHSCESCKTTTRTMASNNNPQVYNVDVRAESSKKHQYQGCLDLSDEKDKDCKCNPPLPSPPCKTTDCRCLIKAAEEDSRKIHKPYCPSYKHKADCPTLKVEEEEQSIEKDEDESDALPYGLPPIQLGPCPVLGRPCTVPDGFARMYKTAVQPTQPPSWSDAGKICCSKEFERIKKALKEYMDEHKKDDYRCLNRFYVDTEKRCCDKEQRLLALTGKACCGSHKLAIQDEYKKIFEREASKKSNREANNL